jgi:H+/Cl- antiporter ClcA
MEHALKELKSGTRYPKAFVRWLLIAAATGIAGGMIGSAFHIAVEKATEFRTEHGFIVYLLPLAGLAIVALYRLCGLSPATGTNQVIRSIRSKEQLPPVMEALIFVSTALTHLCGGSVGREGAALQIGGGTGHVIGRWLHLDEKDMHLIALCGMSSVFAALFGTPVTAALFALEVVSVGVIYYAGLVPCVIASFAGYSIALWFGIPPVHFALANVPAPTIVSIAQVITLGALCAALSIVFCMALHKTEEYLEKAIHNDYVRIALGGVAVVGLTLLVGTRDYNGAGMDVVARAIGGSARPEAFLLKILFTAVSVGASFKGGEIVPTFFVGATFGCVAGGLLGLDPSFAAAVGLVAMFCGVVNCPVASILLSVELFGSQGLLLFSAACAVSYMLSGNFGLYKTQKIVYSKLKAEWIDAYTKQ